MNRFESKYFNSAKLMVEALILILEKKDFEYITVKEICQKAGVNRSTFYLHYENTSDLLRECLDMLNIKLEAKFNNKEIKDIDLNTNKLEDLIFINSLFLKPYLEYIKENRKTYKAIYKNPNLFDDKSGLNRLYELIFKPIMTKFKINESEIEYILDYYITGISSIVIRWVQQDCIDDIEKIMDIIMKCVRPYN
ncbi:MAG: TetR/AcrR family transcriptional regulator [Anaeroplasmataceae bacterium]